MIMQRGRATGNVGDGTDLEGTQGEITASSTTPTYDLICLSLGNAQSQQPQYITSPDLDSTNLDQPVQDYFSIRPGTHSVGSSGAGYGFTAISEPNWIGPSQFSEDTSSAPFTALGRLSEYDFVLPEDLGERVTASCDYGSFTPFFVGQCPPGSSSVPTSGTTPPESRYTGRLVEPTVGVPCSASGSPESKYFNATGLQVTTSSSGIPREVDHVPEKSVDRGAGKRAQLRTAFRKPKTKRPRTSQTSTISGKKSGQEEEEEQDDALTPEERRARHSHNIVEKQYRNRLNAQFVRLLAVLPADQRSGSSGDDSAISDIPAAEEKRVSKAEVLDLATKRIRALEEERSRLEEENSELQVNVDAMTSAVVSRGLGKTD